MTDAAKALDALDRFSQVVNAWHTSKLKSCTDEQTTETIRHALRILSNKDDKLCVVSRASLSRPAPSGVEELKAEICHQLCYGPDAECNHCQLIRQTVDYLATTGRIAKPGD